MRAGHCDVHPLTSPSVPSVHWSVEHMMYGLVWGGAG
jgi:hypothetical protein